MKRASLKSSKPWFIGMLVTATTLTLTAFIWKEDRNQSDRVAPIEIAETKPQKVTALGRLEPASEVINLFPALDLDGDRVKQILVQRGDSVTAGQIVAILASEDRLQAVLAEARQEVTVARNKLAQVKAGAKNGAIVAQEAQINNLEEELQGLIAANKAAIERWQSEVRTAKVEYDRHESLYNDGAISASARDNKRLAWETARAQLEEAIATQNRSTRTLEAQIASAKATLDEIAEVRPVDIDTARAEVEKAIATKKRAKTELAQAYIRTPIAGKVLKIHTHSGEKIDEEKGIAELGQTEQMVAIAEVYQTDIDRINIGQKAFITCNVFADELRGTVEEIDLQVSQQKVFSNQPGENLDRRVVEVKIYLIPEDSKKVAGMTNLQVQTAIITNTSDYGLSHLP